VLETSYRLETDYQGALYRPEKGSSMEVDFSRYSGKCKRGKYQRNNCLAWLVNWRTMTRTWINYR
jgi:hypothetical protein